MQHTGEQHGSARSADGVAYLDYNASAPLRPEALDAMLPHLRGVGNPASVHAFGRTASEAVEVARRQLAELVGCAPGELIFTSGATEANNLAIRLGVGRGAVVTSGVEHPAVLEAASAWAVDADVAHLTVGVTRGGDVDVTALEAALATGGVGLVSVMAANNETGVVSDLPAVVDAARRAGALVHTDATQAVGRVPIDLSSLDVDLLSLSAHKFGGPQGVGALFLRRSLRLQQRPLLVGGGHERGWRAGTINVAGVVGMGAAAAVCCGALSREASQVALLRDRLEASLLRQVPDSWVNGAEARRLPGTTSMTFRGAPADAVMASMPDIAVSDGSACHAGAPEPSHVLQAMGLSKEDAECTVRFSLGYATTQRDIDRAIDATVRAVARVRGLLGPAVRMPSPRAARGTDMSTTTAIEGR